MPLSEPVAREHLHTRTVTCQGFRRADGLWDIEGHLVDQKTYAFSNEERGAMAPGDPVHDMWLRLTIDDDFIVRGVEAHMDANPFKICPQITPAYEKLVGLTIARGWTRKTKELFSGAHGCTHLLELLGPIATTAFQTIYPIRHREHKERGTSGTVDVRRTPVNTCHALSADGPIVKKHWPDHYTGE